MYKFEKIETYWEQSNCKSTYYFNSEFNAMCRLSIYNGDNFGIISDLYVDPKYSGKGIAKELVSLCEKEIISNCIDYAKIYVTKNTLYTNLLFEYYEKLEYTLFETTQEEYMFLKKLQ